MKELKEGEIICDKCDGKGQQENVGPDGFIAKQYYKCPKCKGTGKLDWVENIVGKTDTTADSWRKMTSKYLNTPESKLISTFMDDSMFDDVL